MGIADAILDLVSSGTTLKENNLKEIEGGVVLQSQVWCERYMELVIVLNLATVLPKQYFLFSFVLSGCTCGKQEGIDWENRSTRHSAWDSWEIGSPFEGGWSIHCMRRVIAMLLSHDLYFGSLYHPMFSLQVVANMRGTDAEEVAVRLKTQPSLSGLQVELWEHL